MASPASVFSNFIGMDSGSLPSLHAASPYGSSQDSRPSLNIRIPDSENGKSIPQAQDLPPLIRKARACSNLRIHVPPSIETGHFAVTEDKHGFEEVKVPGGTQSPGEEEDVFISAESSAFVKNCATCNQDHESDGQSQSDPSTTESPWTKEMERHTRDHAEWRRYCERERWILALQSSGDEGFHDYLHLYGHQPDSPIDWARGLCSCAWLQDGKRPSSKVKLMTWFERSNTKRANRFNEESAETEDNYYTSIDLPQLSGDLANGKHNEEGYVMMNLHSARFTADVKSAGHQSSARGLSALSELYEEEARLQAELAKHANLPLKSAAPGVRATDLESGRQNSDDRGEVILFPTHITTVLPSWFLEVGQAAQLTLLLILLVVLVDFVLVAMLFVRICSL